jgi:hypothetical protein
MCTDPLAAPKQAPQPMPLRSSDRVITLRSASIIEMRSLARIAALLLLILGSVAPARGETFRFEGGSVEIPSGFTGPVEQRRGSELVLYGFAKRHPGRDTATLMQITVYHPPGGLPPIAKDQEPSAAEKYLLGFLAGVERRRTDFSPGAVESIIVNRKAVAKVSWRGRAEGAPMKGVMYCYIHGPRVISFHTQDFDFAPPDDMAAVVRSFEAASVDGAANKGAQPTR